MANERHKAVLAAVAKLSDSMRGTPVPIGMDALMTLAGLMMCVSSADKADAMRQAQHAGKQLARYVELQYEVQRGEYLDHSAGKKH